MIALEVSVNGKLLCVAGAEDFSLLSARITAWGNLGKLTKKEREEAPLVELRVAGLTSREDAPDEHLHWVESLDLKDGDEVSVRLRETDSVDPVRSFTPYDEERHATWKREQWEYAREFYLTFKDEFEPDDDAEADT